MVERPLFCVGKLVPLSFLSIAHRKIDGRVLLFLTIGSTQQNFQFRENILAFRTPAGDWAAPRRAKCPVERASSSFVPAGFGKVHTLF